MELITGVEPKCFVHAHLANEIAPCKLIQASLGLLIPRCGFKIPVASPQTSFGVRLSRIHFSPVGEKWMRDKQTTKDVCGEAKIPVIGFQNLDSRFRSFTGFRIPWAGFRIPQAKNSRIRESRLLRWNKKFDVSPRPSYVPLQRVGFFAPFLVGKRV